MSEIAKRYRLSNIELDFVSLVRSGDNPEARVVLAKSAPEEAVDTTDDGPARLDRSFKYRDLLNNV